MPPLRAHGITEPSSPRATPLKILALASAIALAGSTGWASGHGPVFGLTTPTNAKGGWSFDLGIMGRQGTADTGVMLRGMLSYGITEDVQVSISAPVVFGSAPLAPGRVTGMMSGSGDFEGISAWRFHRQGTSVGRRFENTAYNGIMACSLEDRQEIHERRSF